MSAIKQRRPSPIALVQKYFAEGPGAESGELLSQISNAQERPGQRIALVPKSETVRDQEPTGSQAITSANSQAITSAITSANKQAVKQSNKQSFQQLSEQSPQQSIRQSLQQTVQQTIEQSNANIWLPLTENQGKILLFLLERGAGLTNMDIICADTGIPYGTARSVIDTLVRGGYIVHKARYSGASFRGFEYVLNGQLCTMYANKVRGTNQEEIPWQAIQQSVKQSVQQSAGRPSPSSSSLKETQPTTTENQGLLKDPELGYWREKGVNGRQLGKWAEEFDMSEEQILQALKYCRYEMVVLNHEEEKQINNTVNWFYKVMQRSGLYPKPAGYKSLAELRVEQMEQEAKEAQVLRERQEKAERALEFQKIMADPVCPEYQALLNQASEFSKDAGGSVLIDEMESIFMGTRIASHEDLARTD